MTQHNTQFIKQAQIGLQTDFTRKFGLKYPILNAGMGHVALPDMVAAVSNAGGLGVLGGGSAPPELVRERIREIRKLTDKPFGVNCPLALPNAMANAKVALEEQVPVINYSMGRGDWIVEGAAKYGGWAVASVNSVKLAKSAQKHGAAAVIAAGYEAAGHAGEVGSFVLIQRLSEVLDVPLIAAGGIATGKGVIGALALGASAVSIGTRFATTRESPWHENFKQEALRLDVDNTVISDKFDGIPCRMMATQGASDILNSQLNPLSVFVYSFKVAKEVNIPYARLFFDVIKKGPREAINMMRMAQMLKANQYAFDGDMVRGMNGVGQSMGLIQDIPDAEGVIRQLILEIEEEKRRFDAIFTA